MVENSETPFDECKQGVPADVYFSYEPDKQVEIITENYNASIVMHPGEVDALVIELIQDAENASSNPAEGVEQYRRLLNYFRREWRQVWLLHGDKESGWPFYREVIQQAMSINQAISPALILQSNKSGATRTFYTRILMAAFNPSLLSHD